MSGWRTYNIHVQWNISHGKEWNNSICNNMDGPRDYHIKWRQRKTNIIYHLYVESKKMIQINLFTKEKLTHRHGKQTYGSHFLIAYIA